MQLWNVILILPRSDGPHLMSVIGKDVYQGVTLAGSLVSFESARKRLIDELLVHLTKRFESDAEVLMASSIANFSQWPPRCGDEPGVLSCMIVLDVCSVLFCFVLFCFVLLYTFVLFELQTSTCIFRLCFFFQCKFGLHATVCGKIHV